MSETPEPSDFRTIVQEEVAAKGMTPADLAREAGITYSQAYHYLNGQRDLTGEALGRVCNALGLRLTGRRRRQPPSR